MKFLASSLTLLALASISSAQAPSRNPKSDLAKKDECSISGMVIKLAGSAPLKGAKVQLRSIEDRSHTMAIVTDVGGYFVLKGLAPGSYNLSVSKNGFVDQQYGQRKPGDPGSVLTLRLGQDLKDLLFRLIPSAVISGRILDEEGDPLPWAAVSAVREVYSDGKRRLSSEATFRTNDLGEFRIFGLPPGRYFVSVSYRSKEDNDRMQWQEREESQGGSELGYAKLYYPGTPDPGRASAFAVKAGDEIPAVEILLRKYRVYRILGRVQSFLNVAPRRGRGINLSLVPKGAEFETDNGELQVFADKDGSFEIRDVLPGSYILKAYSFDDNKWHATRSTVDVANSDVEGVSLLITPGISISGKVLWDGTAPPQENELIVAARPVDQADFFGGSGRVDSSNSFTLQNMTEGTYRAQVWNPPKDCFLKDVRYAGKSVLEEGFPVTRGAASSLEIVLSSRAARVQGTVTDSDKLPAAGVWVVAVPEGKYRARFDLYRQQTTDQYGHFDFHGLPPGEYKLFSWEEVENGAWQDPEFLRPVESQGEKIELSESDQKTVNLTAIRTASLDQRP
jgi:protocatechuate 3,4-dioxygenase beta subunit